MCVAYLFYDTSNNSILSSTLISLSKNRSFYLKQVSGYICERLLDVLMVHMWLNSNKYGDGMDVNYNILIENAKMLLKCMKVCWKWCCNKHEIVSWWPLLLVRGSHLKGLYHATYTGSPQPVICGVISPLIGLLNGYNPVGAHFVPW